MPKTKTPDTVVATKRAGKSLEDFRNLHDKTHIIPKLIRAGIAKLGPDGWDYDGPFGKLAGVSTTDLNAYRDQFAVFQAMATTTKSAGGGQARAKVIWAGSAAFAKKLGGPREIISE